MWSEALEAVAMAWRCVRAADGLLARDSGIAEERCIHDALIPATVSVACEGGEKRLLFPNLMTRKDDLPRQARDNARKRQKRSLSFRTVRAGSPDFVALDQAVERWSEVPKSKPHLLPQASPHGSRACLGK